MAWLAGVWRDLRPQYQIRKPAMRRTAAPPMAMPAMAPVERGLEEEEAVAASLVVAAGVAVAVLGGRRKWRSGYSLLRNWRLRRAMIRRVEA